MLSVVFTISMALSDGFSQASHLATSESLCHLSKRFFTLLLSLTQHTIDTITFLFLACDT
jgi:hypothetical protein